MATFAIGDVHGCFGTLRELLARTGYRRGQDRLWFTGDLVNRGPASLDVLRFVADLGDDAVVVLGNHDLHLLARAAGVEKARRGDTLDEVLEAPDRDALLGWLRGRPLLHREQNTLLVHAGLLPQWSPADAESLARDAESALRAPDGANLLDRASRPAPRAWSDDLPRGTRVRLALDAMTRLRACRPDGAPELGFTAPPEELPRGARPWFEVPGRRSREVRILFGHWAALGARSGPGWACLDSGCAWGVALTSMRLEDGALTRVATLDAIPGQAGA